MTALIGVAPQRTIDDWRIALDMAMASSPAAGSEEISAGRPDSTPFDWTPFDWTFMDGCRKAFLAMRSQLRERAVIAVVSPNRGDGRSAIAAGLALGAARYAQEDVALLDLDFEKPEQPRIFAVPSQPGLADYLLGGTRLRAIRSSANRRMVLLPAGALEGQGAWLQHSVASSSLLEVCRERFAWTVADFPPLCDGSQARPLSDLADAYLLVGRHRRTTIAALRAAAARLAPGRPAGFVMTGAA